MKNSTIKICDAIIHPGESLSLAMPLPEIFSCAPLHMPIKVIHGKQKGPCVLITAAMHGDEINGTEIINRLLDLNLLKSLRGTVIAVPVLNVYGLLNRSRFLPNRRLLDHSFPGSERGHYAERVAHIISTTLLPLADYLIDLQTGLANHAKFPQVHVKLSESESLSLAKAFNSPVISDVETELGSLRAMADEANKPMLVYEAGEAKRFDEHAIKVGMRGIVNVLRKIKMLKESSKKQAAPKSFITKQNRWLHSPSSGIAYTKLRLGQHVKKGDELAVIKDPFGASDDVVFKSTHEGVLVGKNNLPLVHEGEALFELAEFSEMTAAASHLGDWQVKSAQHFSSEEKGE